MKRLLAIFFNFLLLTVPGLVWAAEGLEVPEALGKKIDLTSLNGINYFLANLYNESLWLYALVCTVIMAVVGMCIAKLADLVLKMIGMETHKIEHHE